MTLARRSVPAVVALLALGGCGSEAPARDALTIAIADNTDLKRVKALAKHFTATHPGVRLEWVTHSEGELRQKVTTDVATKGGQYDVVALGAYETEIWSKKKLLEPMTNLPASYRESDLLPNVKRALTSDGKLYALPVYGESSFTMYREDLFAKAGLSMPAKPTWSFIVNAAAKIESSGALEGGSGVCLRGKPGWGENVALLTAIANSYGGRWFDQNWKPQVDSPQWRKAMETYLALGKHAPKTVAKNGYNENLSLFEDGKCGIWIDSTAAGSSVSTAPAVKGNVGYAPAPSAGLAKDSSWLWTWSFAVPTSSKHKSTARKFAAWATSPEYAELVTKEYGVVNAPPGTRKALYRNNDYLEAAPFAKATAAAINSADPEEPTVDPVPYVGIQYVAIPEFQGIGTAFGNRAAKALTGEIDGPEALKNGQWVTTKVMGKQDRQVAK